MIVLASPSAVAQVPSDVGDSVRLVAVGPTTAAAIERRGWRCLQAPSPTVAGLMEVITSTEEAGPSAARRAEGGTDDER